MSDDTSEELPPNGWIDPSGRVAVFRLDGSIPEYEARGPELASDITRRLRSAIQLVGDVPAPPPGPHFRYEDGPTLFLGRSGEGPLDVAWDTNVLIDYFEFGAALWDGGSLPEDVAGAHGEELEALQVIVSLWVVRDIRFHLSAGVVDDAKRKLSAVNLANRRQALEEFAAALRLDFYGDDEVAPVDAQLDLPGSVDPTRAAAMSALPRGFDRVLVEDALQSGAHVFLTQDGGILKRCADFAALGLLIASPQDLVEELAACGALHCLLEPQYAYWPIPDLQRVSHLIGAIPQGQDG